MSSYVQGAAAAAKDAYPRDNFNGESSDQSFDYLPPSDQTSDQPKQLKPLNQSQQQLPSVGALPLPQNPPRGHSHPPSFQTSNQPQQQEPFNGVPSPGCSTKDDHGVQSHRSFNQPTTTDQTSLKSQPKQPPNQPQKQQRPIEAPSKDQQPLKKNNQSQLQQPPPPARPPPSKDNVLVPSLNPQTRAVQGADPPSQPEKDEHPIKNHAKLTNDEPVLAFPDPTCLPESYLNQLPMYVQFKHQSIKAQQSNPLPEPGPPLSPPPPAPPQHGCCCSIL